MQDLAEDSAAAHRRVIHSAVAGRLRREISVLYRSAVRCTGVEQSLMRQ
jgi:hypothetical protein